MTALDGVVTESDLDREFSLEYSIVGDSKTATIRSLIELLESTNMLRHNVNALGYGSTLDWTRHKASTALQDGVRQLSGSRMNERVLQGASRTHYRYLPLAIEQ